MTGFRVLDERAAWQRDFEERRRRAYRAAGLGPEAAEGRVARLREGERAEEWTVAEITDGGTRIGYVAVDVTDDHGTPVGRVEDLWINAEHAGQGREQAARAWAEAWCAERGARRIAVRVTGPDGGPFADYPVAAELRIRTLDAGPPPPSPVVARPMAADEFPRWFAAEKDAYIGDIVRAATSTRDEAVRKAEDDFAELLPRGQATPGHAFVVLEAADGPVGTGWLHHGHLPGVTYGYSLDIDAEHRGKGYGRAALAAGEQLTRTAGDTALMFTVWGGNEVAMRLYDRAGYRVVETSRSLPLTG